MGNAHQVESGKWVSIFPLAPAHLVGLGAFQLALVLMFFHTSWALFPLGGFVLIMLVAPLFPRWRLLMPVITKIKSKNSVVLTFDDGPDPLTTPMLLELLKRHEAKAVFFLVGQKVHDHPDLVKMIMDEGHEIGNHTMEHDVFLALKPIKRLSVSIDKCQDELESLGLRPRLFRPPAWIVRPGLWRILLEQGMVCVDARVKSLDLGNRRVSGMARRVLKRIRPGDIISLHDTTPGSSYSVSQWLEELEKIIEGIESMGLATACISKAYSGSRLHSSKSSGVEGVRFFYDSLAEDYDEEQTDRVQGALRQAEFQIAQKRLDDILMPHMNVLEVGAGTGRFTVELAKRAKRVQAVDLSPVMLQKLAQKAECLGLENIETVAADIRQVSLSGPYDLICSFSAFEYTPDLSQLLSVLSPLLSDDGTIYFTTAHTCFFRFFTQLGNAMRQGVWLHSRTLSEIKRAMEQAGLQVKILAKFGPLGMLVQAQGKKN